MGEILAAHIWQAGAAQNAEWKESAMQELVTLLRDDYPTLMSVSGALSDVGVGE